MKKPFLLFCILVSLEGFAQNVIDVDKNAVNLSSRIFYTVGGAPFSTMKYVRVTSGSPYFSENWMRGIILVNDSTTFTNIRLRLDLLEGVLIYLNEKDEEMVSVAPIREVSLTDTIENKTYYFVHASVITDVLPTDKVWYQRLAGFKTVLYKQYYKDFLESKAYASSITEQSIVTDERYFVWWKGAMTRIKKINEIPEILFDKRAQLNAFIEKNKLKGKNESDFVKLIDYYNSL